MNKKQIFLSRLAKILNRELEDVEKMLSKRPNQSLRLNQKHPSYNDILSTFTADPDLLKIEWAKNSFEIKNNKIKFTRNNLFDSGAYYIQNASSFLPILALNPIPGDVILDMCSSPGGKLFNIDQDSDGNSFLYANDENSPRLSKLKQMATKYAINVIHFFNSPGQYLHKKTDQRFDKILVDAPCSGEGELDLSDPNSLNTWSLNKIKRLPRVQLGLLNSAYLLLNKGGTLVYSTCTFAPEENEDVVKQFLDKHKDMSLGDITINIDNIKSGLSKWGNNNYDSSLSKCIRVVPNHFMEGFFVARFIKS